jgi:hypothetical protein
LRFLEVERVSLGLSAGFSQQNENEYSRKMAVKVDGMVADREEAGIGMLQQLQRNLCVS